MKTPAVRVQIPLDYDAIGAKCLVVSGPFIGELKYGNTPVEYSIGVFITDSFPTPELKPDIEIRVHLSDVISLKNALAAIQIAAGQ